MGYIFHDHTKANARARIGKLNETNGKSLYMRKPDFSDEVFAALVFLMKLKSVKYCLDEPNH